MRLIDADLLKSDHNMGDECNKCKTKWRECQYDYIYSKMDFCTWIDDAPTIDAVEVVRCKDCIYGDTYEMGLKLNNAIRCNIHDDGYEMHEPDWFCADGKVKQDIIPDRV